MRLMPLLALAALLTPLAAHADTLDFHLTPTDGVGGVYDFTSTDMPVTGQQSTDGYFGISPTGTGGFFNGPDTIFFTVPNSGYAGTIQLINSDFSTQVFFDGPQLFSGTADAPTLLTGSFFLTNLTVPSPTVNSDGSVTIYPVPDGDQVGQSYNLTVTDITTAPAPTPAPTPTPTPEPSSLVLLGTGIIGLAGAVRRRLRA